MKRSQEINTRSGVNFRQTNKHTDVLVKMRMVMMLLVVMVLQVLRVLLNLMV